MGKLQRLASTVASTALMCALVSNGQAGQGIDEKMLLELKK